MSILDTSDWGSHLWEDDNWTHPDGEAKASHERARVEHCHLRLACAKALRQDTSWHALETVKKIDNVKNSKYMKQKIDNLKEKQANPQITVGDFNT